MTTRTIKIPKLVNGVATGETEDIQVDDYGNSGWGPKDKHAFVNTKVPRVDAPFKTTGTARYTHDVRLPGMLHGRFVNSIYAHAMVTKIDVAPALAIEGVKGAKPIIQVGQPTAEVRFEGQPIVAVVAITPEIAEDAARAVVVTYEVLPHVVNIDDALKPDAPRVVTDRGGRGGGAGGARGGGRGVAGAGTPEAADAAIAACDVVVEAEYNTPITHHCCLETHSTVVDFHAGAADATVYCSTQGTFTINREAAAELGVPVVGVVEHMGGGFGSKLGGIGFAGQWACRFSKELGVPVKFVMTRKEEFLNTGNGQGSRHKFRAGANKDGTLVALNVQQWSMAGLGGRAVAAQPYQYRPSGPVYFNAVTVNTHEDSSVPLRAPGHPQACFAMESLMDDLAAKLDIDPIEFRKKNLPDVAWHRQLDTGAKAIGWERRNKTPGGGAANGPLRRGMGCAVGAWGGGGGGGCAVPILIRQDGSVLVTNGSQDIGTGTRTYVRSIVAEELGLELSQVQEKIGQTTYGAGRSSGGSATTASLAPAVKDGAYKARMAMSEIIAPLLGTTPDGVWFNKGQILGNGKALSWKQACAAIPPAGISVSGAFVNTLAGQGAHGTSFAEVEIDVETGFVRVVKMCHVQDGGLIMNRLACESQINGGMIQSVGMALYEGRIMDSNLGTMVNPAFNDYKIPGCMEIPELIPIIDDGDTRNVCIGIAEPANIPGCGAIGNAIHNAIGIRIGSTPMTPDKILNALVNQRRNA